MDIKQIDERLDQLREKWKSEPANRKLIEVRGKMLVIAKEMKIEKMDRQQPMI